jgi:hypothetical protein
VKLQRELERCHKICFKALGIESENAADDNKGRYAEERKVAARQMSGGQSFFILSVNVVYSQSAVLHRDISFLYQSPFWHTFFPNVGVFLLAYSLFNL